MQMQATQQQAVHKLALAAAAAAAVAAARATQKGSFQLCSAVRHPAYFNISCSNSSSSITPATLADTSVCSLTNCQHILWLNPACPTCCSFSCSSSVATFSSALSL
jgi:hypothetical protein